MLKSELLRIFGEKNVIDDNQLLNQYKVDKSFMEGCLPMFIVKAHSTEEVVSLLDLANKKHFPIIPVSSSKKTREHGDTVPRCENTIILDLTEMNRILDIDRKNRVVRIQPGVTFEQLIPILKKKGLRLLTPLSPNLKKSILTSALEREPIIIPRYHWDSSDPLLCTELVFGSGKYFRTGSAAGPGTLEEQKKSGQAQVNPMGPTQFSPFRIVQGAQGSIGVVTWATLKLELLPTEQKVFHIQSEKLEDLLELQLELIKYRLCDEIFILDNNNSGCLFGKSRNEAVRISKDLKKWNLFYILSGRGQLASEKIKYLISDIEDLQKTKDLCLSDSNYFNPEILLNTINNGSSDQWRAKRKGSFLDIFFLSNYEKIEDFTILASESFEAAYGVYIQAINQGTAYHCEFDLHYDDDSIEKDKLKNIYIEFIENLIKKGAFFNRPYGVITEQIFKEYDESAINAYKKVKKIFDPNHILNPNVLCFTNEKGESKD